MRKGISQIVSSVLLLAIAISVTGFYSQWAPDFAETISQDAADQSNNQIKCSSAGINIENTSYDITGDIAELEIENTGTIRLSDDIQAVALNSSQVIGNTTISELEVGETELVTIRSDQTPERLIASSTTCPELSVETFQIDISE